MYVLEARKDLAQEQLALVLGHDRILPGQHFIQVGVHELKVQAQRATPLVKEDLQELDDVCMRVQALQRLNLSKPADLLEAVGVGCGYGCGCGWL